MNIKTRRKSLAMLAVAAVTGVTALAVAGPALAARQPQDGVHPKNSICFEDKNKKVAKTANIYGAKGVKVGKIDLMYSPNCRTVWARVETTFARDKFGFSPDYQASANVIRLGKHSANEVCEIVKGTKACNSEMLNDKDMKSIAKGFIFHGGKWREGTTASY